MGTTVFSVCLVHCYSLETRATLASSLSAGNQHQQCLCVIDTELTLRHRDLMELTAVKPSMSVVCMHYV